MRQLRSRFGATDYGCLSKPDFVCLFQIVMGSTPTTESLCKPKTIGEVVVSKGLHKVEVVEEVDGVVAVEIGEAEGVAELGDG